MKELGLDRDRIFSEFISLSTQEKIGLLRDMVENLQQQPEDTIPLSIFDNVQLSILESVVKYLKEVKRMRFVHIATLLGRSDKTIWGTYQKSRSKMPDLFSASDDSILIPVSLFADRSLTVFEHVVFFLKEQGRSNKEIGERLHRDNRTIWTVYHNALKKKK